MDANPSPKSPLFHHGLRAALIAQAAVGSALGIASAFVIPALRFRLEAGRDARVFLAAAFAATLLAALEAGLVAAWSARRMREAALPFRPVRRRELALAFLLPAACTALAVRAQATLMEREDPLLTYVERNLAHALAQPGIGSRSQLEVEEGRLTLVVPLYLVRNATWRVELDAGDTEGRRCELFASATFGADPVVVRVPVPLHSEERMGQDFSLVPGSIVVVRGIRVVMDEKDPARKAGAPTSYSRSLDLVYEVPELAHGAKLDADFVAAPGQR